jgi:hypothetical protein
VRYPALLGLLIAVTLGTSSTGAGAQTAGAKPTCAAGDTVVWENTNSKAYHLPGDKYYGNTKHGAYACRSAADSAGYHLAGAKSSVSPSPAASESPTAMHRKHHHRSGSMASPVPSPTPT